METKQCLFPLEQFLWGSQALTSDGPLGFSCLHGSLCQHPPPLPRISRSGSFSCTAELRKRYYSLPSLPSWKPSNSFPSLSCFNSEAQLSAISPVVLQLTSRWIHRETTEEPQTFTLKAHITYKIQISPQTTEKSSYCLNYLTWFFEILSLVPTRRDQNLNETRGHSSVG